MRCNYCASSGHTVDECTHLTQAWQHRQCVIQKALETLDELRMSYDYVEAKPSMQLLITGLIEAHVYPTTSPNGRPINILERVNGWGSRWHEYKGLLNCTKCNADFRNLEHGPPFKREIGLSTGDHVFAYRCPDCGIEWSRHHG